MNIDEAVARACEEPTILKALSWMAVWESERIVVQARGNETWETCCETSFEHLVNKWKTCHTVTNIFHTRDTDRKKEKEMKKKMNSTLFTTFKVETPTREICRLMQLNAFEAGYAWDSNKENIVRNWTFNPHGLSFYSSKLIRFCESKTSFVAANPEITLTPTDAVKHFASMVMENSIKDPELYIDNLPV